MEDQSDSDTTMCLSATGYGTAVCAPVCKGTAVCAGYRPMRGYHLPPARVPPYALPYVRELLPFALIREIRHNHSTTLNPSSFVALHAFTQFSCCAETQERLLILGHHTLSAFQERILRSCSNAEQQTVIILALKGTAQKMRQHEDCNDWEAGAGRRAARLAWADC